MRWPNRGIITTTPAHCRAFSVPFNRAASLADNLDFLRDILGELRRWAPKQASYQQ